MTSECLYSGFSDVRYTNCALLESGVVRLDRHASAPYLMFSITVTDRAVHNRLSRSTLAVWVLYGICPVAMIAH